LHWIRGTTETADPAFTFETRTVADGYEYWQSKLRDGMLPNRSDIHPSEIPRLLPHTMLIDVQRQPEWDFRYRLIGTKIAEHFFRDYTGSWFSAVGDDHAESGLGDNCRTVAETAAPLYANTEYAGPHQSFRRAEDIILPLAEDGANVDSLLVFVSFLPRT
jgi:hypothetical protein